MSEVFLFGNRRSMEWTLTAIDGAKPSWSSSGSTVDLKQLGGSTAGLKELGEGRRVVSGNENLPTHAQLAICVAHEPRSKSSSWKEHLARPSLDRIRATQSCGR